MALPFDHSRLGLQDEPLNGQFLQFNNSNNFGLNTQMNHPNNVLLSSQLRELHQAELISQLRGSTSNITATMQPTVPCLGQFSLSQRLVLMNEVSGSSTCSSTNNTTCCGPVPQRVQLVQTVNIDYFPIQNQSTMSAGNYSYSLGDQVYVTGAVRTQDVVRTHLLNSASTRERFLAPINHDYGALINTNQGSQPHLLNQPIPNVVHSYFLSSDQYSSLNRTKNSSGTPSRNFGYDQYRSHHAPNSSFNNYQNPPIRKRSATLRLLENDIDDQQLRFLDPEPLNVYFSGGAKNDHDRQLQNLPSNFDDDHHQDHNNGNDEIKDDGRTHSLPYKKYGPYTCPRCMGLFATSQMFAAHMGSHYKYESAEERRKRHMAKYGKKKCLRLVNSNDGLTVIPTETEPLNYTTRNENEVKLSEEIMKEISEKKLKMGANRIGGPDLEGLFEVPIKEEPLEIS